MQPQKVPAWANEPSVQPSNIEKSNDTEEVKLHDLSDMEWMRQRMSQHVDQENDVEQSDTESPQGNKLVRSNYLHAFLVISCFTF